MERKTAAKTPGEGVPAVSPGKKAADGKKKIRRAGRPGSGKAALISFTERGGLLCGRIAAALEEAGWETDPCGPARLADKTGLPPQEQPLSRWTEIAFFRYDALIFIGAAGIAVRAIAPWVRDKLTDPAVLSIDERGRCVIPLLSGHAGGANRLAEIIAGRIGAFAAISTATDLSGVFAADSWAADQGLVFARPERDRITAREISAALLEGKTIGLWSALPVEGPMPEGLCPAGGGFPPPAEPLEYGIVISYREDSFPEKKEDKEDMEKTPGREPVFARTLRLIPRHIIVGMGCRKNADPDEVRRFFEETLRARQISEKAVAGLCSVDLKLQEPALLRLAEEKGLPFSCFSAGRLKAARGTEASSSFVERVAGVDNVCERAAVTGCREMLAEWRRAEKREERPPAPDRENSEPGKESRPSECAGRIPSERDAETALQGAPPAVEPRLILPRQAGRGVTLAAAAPDRLFWPDRQTEKNARRKTEGPVRHESLRY